MESVFALPYENTRRIPLLKTPIVTPASVEGARTPVARGAGEIGLSCRNRLSGAVSFCVKLPERVMPSGESLPLQRAFACGTAKEKFRPE